MIRYSQPGFDANDIIEEYLVTPATVTTDGLLGRFDSLRVALEHLQTRDTANTILAIQAPNEELQFADEALESLTVSFTRWLYNAGLFDDGIPE